MQVVRDSILNASGPLPRDLHSLHLLYRLIALGSSAHALVTGVQTGESPMDSIIFTKFFPAITAMIAEDVIRAELTRGTGGPSDALHSHWQTT
jgi:hypothetical protein